METGLADDGTILYDTKNIEDIEVGDLVYSYDTATGEYSYNEVTDTFSPTEGGQKFTDEVTNHPAVQHDPQSNGRDRYWVNDLGRNVGRDQRGNLTRGGEVIVEGANPKPWSVYAPGEVVTQYPK